MSITTVEFSIAHLEPVRSSLSYQSIDVHNRNFNGQVVMFHHDVQIGTLNFIGTKEILDISEKSPLEKLAEISSARNKGLNVVTRGLKELQIKKQMFRERLIDVVNSALNDGLWVDLIHDELKSLSREVVIVCDNLDSDFEDIPF
ncbi:hypothetical protein OJ22_07250 [Proteus mirabilis]|uniref:hypothetical protein n=1 Tax=Proteus mirabilis TaxID=584 RepID=UPI00073B3DD0|nr:hypothetical protein [Proteus mirabilis]KSW19536.1 hypothetical protein OJ22_07250 [Proteus mirabilis]MDM3690767.1 hypothetical protein [Proteus mirabilis]MDW8538435.1 hypothetical protein [Proteus mirabilis]